MCRFSQATSIIKRAASIFTRIPANHNCLENAIPNRPALVSFVKDLKKRPTRSLSSRNTRKSEADIHYSGIINRHLGGPTFKSARCRYYSDLPAGEWFCRCGNKSGEQRRV